MRHEVGRHVLALAALLLGTGTALAQTLPEWVQKTKISGLAFGDVYAMVANHDPDVEGANGLWFRRIYLTFDETVDDETTLRLRFEADTPGDFASGGRTTPFVKDAYLAREVGGQTLVLGLSPSPTWDLVEKTWGYRPLEKTPQDLQKLGASRDFGVALKGHFDPEGKVGYHAMLANGSGTRSETNEGKKAMLAVNFRPSEQLLVEVYGDYEGRPGDTDRAMFQVFAAYDTERWRGGVLLARQHRNNAPGVDLDLDLFSIYGVLRAEGNVHLLARFDRLFDPNPEGARIAYLPFSPVAESNLLLLGVDIALSGNVSLMPNLELVFYGESDAGVSPDSDAMARLTFFARF